MPQVFRAQLAVSSFDPVEIQVIDTAEVDGMIARFETGKSIARNASEHNCKQR
jgi:hypothetical protein